MKSLGNADWATASLQHKQMTIMLQDCAAVPQRVHACTDRQGLAVDPLFSMITSALGANGQLHSHAYWLDRVMGFHSKWSSVKRVYNCDWLGRAFCRTLMIGVAVRTARLLVSVLRSRLGSDRVATKHMTKLSDVPATKVERCPREQLLYC